MKNANLSSGDRLPVGRQLASIAVASSASKRSPEPTLSCVAATHLQRLADDRLRHFKMFR